MLGYTLKRLVMMVSTILVLSLLAFGLKECSPTLPIPACEEANRGSASRLELHQSRLQNCRTAIAQQGLNLPIFYFSIGTQAYPDTLLRVIPLERRSNAECLIAQYGNWPAIQAFGAAVDATWYQAMRLQENYRSDALIEVNRLLGQLPRTCEPADQERLLQQLQKAAATDSLCQLTLGSSIQNTLERFSALVSSPTKWRHYVPRLRWHGTANRYHQWASRLLAGDFGISRATKQPVGERIGKAVRWTLIMNFSAIILAYLLSIPLGVYSAVHAQSRFDRWLSIGLFFLYALPSFWVATLASQFLTNSAWLDLFPSMGVGTPKANASWWQIITLRVHHFFLPVFCLTYGSLAYLTRQVRGTMVQVLDSDFIRTARAKGIPERQVIWRHAFLNALFPLITMLANVLPAAVAGAVIIEMIFNIPGIGKLMLDSIFTDDWPIVFAILLIAGILTVVGIFLADLLYAKADPRVRLTENNN